MIELHYAKIDFTGDDIPVIMFDSSMHLCEWIFSKSKESKYVFLGGIESEKMDEVIITSDLQQYIFILDKLINDYCQGLDVKIFHQEYESFEEAYKVALDMKEPDELCYSPKNDDNED